ncbi:hypothetical protein DTL42_17850 [Bremerella cremea]|uniref:SMI1/KNR4 family protein n=1 Tax=Bremerella cremea TaxID=1031537 RepID=A0A368KS30_9BACT|nr:hypothetical protein DTL42_17850 [Bremerella cremea]
MNINGLELPSELVADLKSGGRKLNDDELNRLRTMLNCVESPLPKLFGREAIQDSNQLWESDAAQYYLGQVSNSVVPGDVDRRLTLIIGQAEPDSPIALDYRTAIPRVIYLGDIDHASHWIELSRDYASLVQFIQKGPV